MNCKYDDCKRDVWEGDNEGHCIFHSQKITDAKVIDFDTAFLEFLADRRSADGSYKELNCAGFVFPNPLFFLADATISGHANFMFTNFHAAVSFSGVTFKEAAFFISATFHGKVSFEGATFSQEALFTEAKFKETVEFSGAEFLGRNHFQFTKFSGEVMFRDATISKSIDFHGHEGGPVFLDYVTLDNVDFRKTSIAGVHMTHISKINNVKFGHTDIYNVNWSGSYLLRQQALDQNYLYEFAKKHKIIYRIWKYSSNCGRWLWLWATWSLTFALGYGYLYTLKGPEWFEKACEWDAVSPYYYSFVTFTTLGFGDITPKLDNKWAQIVVTSEVVLGYIMLGGLIAILANKMARRAA